MLKAENFNIGGRQVRVQNFPAENDFGVVAVENPLVRKLAQHRPAVLPLLGELDHAVVPEVAHVHVVVAIAAHPRRVLERVGALGVRRDDHGPRPVWVEDVHLGKKKSKNSRFLLFILLYILTKIKLF